MEYVCWTLNHFLGTGPNSYDRQIKVRDLSILKMICPMLDQPISAVTQSCILQLISRASMGTKSTIETFCNFELANTLSKFLGASNRNTRYLTARIIFNIITTDQIFYDHFYNSKLLNTLIERIQTESQKQIKAELIHLFSGFILHGSSSSFEELLFEYDTINWLLAWTSTVSDEVDLICLKTIDYLLEQGDLRRVDNDRNEVANSICQHEYYGNLMKARESDYEDVSVFASRLMQAHFGTIVVFD